MVRVRYLDSEIRICVPEKVFALYRRTQRARIIKFEAHVFDAEFNQLFKFGIIIYVEPFWRYWTEKCEKIVYKMAASGRTEVASDVQFGVGATFIKLYLWSKFGNRSSNGHQTLTVSRQRRRRSTRPNP